ncbi:hypothetical protein JZU56_04085, partial [bacterium]|nr:hypothetical protein [bacterium]
TDAGSAVKLLTARSAAVAAQAGMAPAKPKSRAMHRSVRRLAGKIESLMYMAKIPSAKKFRRPRPAECCVKD